jgi:iron(III) transport system permease protein
MVHRSHREPLTEPTTTVADDRRDPPAAGRRRLGLGVANAGSVAWTLTIFVVVALVLVIPSLCFLVQAVSPRLFGQGRAWFTLANFGEAWDDGVGRGLADSLVISLTSALGSVLVASVLAWLSERTLVAGRRFFVLGLWAVLLAPTYLVAVGWEELADKGGFLNAAGLWSPELAHLVMGPVGVVVVLMLKHIPFAFFAIAPALAAVSGDLEHAVRTHGGGPRSVVRTVGPVLLPALAAGFIIVFAESMGDFGVADTIAASAHFPVATYTLYEAISSFPTNYGVAAVVGLALVASVGLALTALGVIQRGRSYAVISGRAKPAVRRQLTWRGQAAGLGFVGVVFAAALGVPVLGLVASSLLTPFRGLHWSSFTLQYYRPLLGVKGLGGPISFSGEMAAIGSVATVVFAAVLARTLSSGRSGWAGGALNVTLLAAVALPGVVFAAGYIFAFNLPALSDLGLSLYGTVPLLAMAYIASATPGSSRILLGPLAQVQGSLLSAARVHGAGLVRAWRQGVLPLLARPIIWCMLLAFAGIFLELPISEMLYPPGTRPLSVAILSVLGKANIGQGTALSVVAVLITLAIVGVVLGAFRLLAPRGWRTWQQAGGPGAPKTPRAAAGAAAGPGADRVPVKEVA